MSQCPSVPASQRPSVPASTRERGTLGHDGRTKQKQMTQSNSQERGWRTGMLEWRGLAACGRAWHVKWIMTPSTRHKRIGHSPRTGGWCHQAVTIADAHQGKPRSTTGRVINKDGHWINLLGMHPTYQHRTGDQRSIVKLTIAHPVVCGACRQVKIITALGISKGKLSRALRRYRADWIEAFLRASRRLCSGPRYSLHANGRADARGVRIPGGETKGREVADEVVAEGQIGAPSPSPRPAIRYH